MHNHTNDTENTPERTQRELTSDDKYRSARDYLTALVDDLERSRTLLTALLEEPGPDRAHFYAESVRLASAVVDHSTARRDNLVELAAQQPDRLSFPRLSTLSNLSVNTLRNRMGLNPGTRSKRSLGTPDF